MKLLSSIRLYEEKSKYQAENYTGHCFLQIFAETTFLCIARNLYNVYSRLKSQNFFSVSTKTFVTNR